VSLPPRSLSLNSFRALIPAFNVLTISEVVSPHLPSTPNPLALLYKSVAVTLGKGA